MNSVIIIIVIDRKHYLSGIEEQRVAAVQRVGHDRALGAHAATQLQLLHEVHHVEDHLHRLDALRDRVEGTLQHAMLYTAAARRSTDRVAMRDAHGVTAHHQVASAHHVAIGTGVLNFARGASKIQG